jgi:regulator of PEP synthase PpsR (kinase-PPPase family)
MTNKQAFTVFILSDGTGETATAMVRAGLVQYPEKDVQIVRCKNVRTEDQIESLVEEVFTKRGCIVHTMVSPEMRASLLEKASEKGILTVDLMGPVLTALDAYLGNESRKSEAGILRTVDERYFKRIEAIEFTVKHDDGKLTSGLEKADIVLVGISRTSKTPLSIFLSHKGWKVANVPLVLGTPIPDELFTIDQRKVIGLTIDHASLSRIRKKRLEKFGQDPGSEYASLAHIQKEIDFANDLFKKNKRWPVFNVTDRALEETAAEIVRLVAARMDIPYGAML